MGLTDIEKAALYDLVRPEVRKMSMQMEEKFRLYDKERGNPFACDDESFITERMNEEMDELQLAIDDGAHPSKVWKESADVCNFILMQAVLYDKNWFGDHRGRK